ncbi:hypothetical protein KJ865_03335, partial [Myxococcota bacterium]|nr:hypothetical protein [Myxococcota bacterium]
MSPHKNHPVTVGALVSLSLVLFASCGERYSVSENITEEPVVVERSRKVDMLFVIDNSLSSSSPQSLLTSQFAELVRVLRETPGGLPDLHIGVTTTDLGAAPYKIPSCETQGGDGGRLLKGADNNCTNPVGQNYIVDITPARCTVERDNEDQRLCLHHNCTAVNCDPALFPSGGGDNEPAGLQLYTDENGCPRCRNYDRESLKAV